MSLGLKVNRRRIAETILATKPGLAALDSGATGATTGENSARGGAAPGTGLGVSELISGKSAAPKRSLSAATSPAAGPTARRHVARNKKRRKLRQEMTMAVKLVQIPYQRLPELKAKAKLQKSFRLKPLTPRFLRRSAGQFALVADRSPLKFFCAS